MKTIKKIITDVSFLTVACVFLCSFIISCFFVSPVSASSISYSSASSFDSSFTSSCIESFYSNSSVTSFGFSEDNSIMCFDGSYYNYLLCFKVDSSCTVGTIQDSSGVYHTCIYSDATSYIYKSYTSFTPASLDSVTFGNFVNASYYKPCVVVIDDSHFCVDLIQRSNNRLTRNSFPTSPYDFCFSNGGYVAPFKPSGVTSFTGLDLDFNESDFYQWLVDNNKIDISGSNSGVSVSGKIPSYIGMIKLASFIHFYHQFGGSNTSFFKYIYNWFSYMNIVSQTKDNVNILKNTIDSLYQEYINSYIHEIVPNMSGHAHNRKNIITQTDDNNLSLVTDDTNDTVDTSILRDILRGIIQISNNVANSTDAIIRKLDQLNFTVNVANNGGTFNSSEIWGFGDITESSNYNTLVSEFETRGIDISAAENLSINPLSSATQKESFSITVLMPDSFSNGEFSSKSVTHTIDSNSKMYNTLILFRKIIGFSVIIYYAIRLRFSLPSLIRGE